MYVKDVLIEEEYCWLEIYLRVLTSLTFDERS